MLNLNSLLLFSEAPKKLIDFYRKVLALEPKWQEEEYTGFEVGAYAFVIGPHSKVHGPNKNPERLMFNFETSDVKGEFERIKGLGAKGEWAIVYYSRSLIASFLPTLQSGPSRPFHGALSIRDEKVPFPFSTSKVG